MSTVSVRGDTVGMQAGVGVERVRPSVGVNFMSTSSSMADAISDVKDCALEVMVLLDLRC